jgi:basic membrane protein A
MKKLLALLVVVLMVTVSFAGCNAAVEAAETEPAESTETEMESEAAEMPAEEPFKVALVLSVGGLGDGSYNDSVYEGFVRAENDLGVEVQLVEPEEVAEMQGHFVQLAKSGEYDIIFGVGYDCEEYVVATAEQFPDQKFVIMDSTVADVDNITTVQISGPEMCFLAGVIAGLYTESNITGIMAGMEGPSMTDRCIVPFTAGLKLTNSDATVLTKYSGSWSDASAGKEVALALYQEGCDVIMPYAGGSGLGVFTAAQEKGFYVIGAGENQNDLAPDLTIASGLFFYGNLAYQLIEEGMAGTLTGGLRQAGLAENGVGYTTEGSNVPMDQATVDLLEQVRQKVEDGEVIVPIGEDALQPALDNNAQVTF